MSLKTQSLRSLPPAVSVALVIVAAVIGCEKPPTGADEQAPKNFFPVAPKVDYSQVKVDKPVEPAAAIEPVADTWASRIRQLVQQAHESLQKCRNDYMIPFQFEKMRLRNVEWLVISEMDAVCRDGDAAAKTRGPWSILTFLAKDHIGKHPALDRFIALGHDHVEHFRMVSLMTKKVGSPKIADVTDVAKASRDRVLEAGRLLDEAAREIASFSDDLAPHDGPESAAATLDGDAARALFASHYDFLLGDVVAAYDRLASNSWQSPNMIKKATMRLWADIPTKLLQHDRPRLEKVTGLSDSERKAIGAYFDRVDAVVAAWRKSYDRYMESKEGDTWAAKDPYRPALVKAHKEWQKAHAALRTDE